MEVRDRTRRLWSRVHARSISRRLAPFIHARAAIVLDQDGQTRWAKQPDLALHGRSTIKLLACLTAREELDLYESLTVTSTDTSPHTVLQAGDSLLVTDLIHAALLYSDSTAVLTLARSAGERMPGDGDAISRFLDAMHVRGRRAGWEGHVTDPRGFGEENRVTARGMAGLLRHITLNDPWLCGATGPISYNLTISGGRKTTKTVENRTNGKLSDFIAAKGGTNGFDPHSDAYLVWSWRHGDGTIRTAAIMGTDARNRYLDARAIAAM